MQIREYSENVLHAKNRCYTVGAYSITIKLTDPVAMPAHELELADSKRVEVRRENNF